MPVQECTSKGKSGHQWGEEGFCYIGTNSEQLAARQGRAIKQAQEKRDSYYDNLNKGNSQ